MIHFDPTTPPLDRAELASLFDLQMWCWGSDVKDPLGNRLTRFGLQRHPAPDPLVGSTRYDLAIDNDATLALWGFGLWLTDPIEPTALFLRRGESLPSWSHKPTAVLSAWKPADLPIHRQPSIQASAASQRLIRRALQWIIDYELWVESTYGRADRLATCARYPRGKGQAHLRTPRDRWIDLATPIGPPANGSPARAVCPT